MLHVAVYGGGVGGTAAKGVRARAYMCVFLQFFDF